MNDAIQTSSIPRRTALLVMGGVRAGRLCPQITAWVAEVGQSCAGWTCDVVDLADSPLPMDDEAAIPALGQPYASACTRAWSEQVKRADAVVFIAPQYNWGYPAALKNAIDHLYAEWRDKPVALVTYGGHGGDRCGRQLRQVAVSVKMRVVTQTAAIRLPEAVIRQGAPLTPERDFRPWRSPVERAFTELAALADGREAWLTRMRRQWRELWLALV